MDEQHDGYCRELLADRCQTEISEDVNFAEASQIRHAIPT